MDSTMPSRSDGNRAGGIDLCPGVGQQRGRISGKTRHDLGGTTAGAGETYAPRKIECTRASYASAAVAAGLAVRS